ncbi:MAG: glyoxylate/hydroxypyruvate reductase A [Colwelliaceae bacterium]|jgi:glyoxylate/hydroxypyruvate reductase A|nr:glyoxylate/hydroxypyruvate reductase A [Colwelliaceae bacterium]
MTKNIIPFISELPLTEQVQWIERLTQLLPNIEIVLESSIGDLDKSHCKVAIVANPNPKILMHYSSLVWIQSVWAGVERLVTEIENPSFDIVRLVDPCLAQTMADAVVAWSYYLHRDMPVYKSQQNNQNWQQHNVSLTSDCTIGVLGLGKLGLASAKKLALNNFNVIGWSQNKKSSENFKCYSGVEGLKTVVSQCNIVVILLPLTNETYGLFNSSLFSLMKSDAGLINFARGNIINNDDLLTALKSKKLSHAVLDVFDKEPLPKDDRLWQNANITILPHISAPTNKETACQIVKSNIDNYFISGNIPSAVDLKKGY